jgi:hypothetical protein
VEVGLGVHVGSGVAVAVARGVIVAVGAAPGRTAPQPTVNIMIVARKRSCLIIIHPLEAPRIDVQTWYPDIEKQKKGRFDPNEKPGLLILIIDLLCRFVSVR